MEEGKSNFGLLLHVPPDMDSCGSLEYGSESIYCRRVVLAGEGGLLTPLL
jgi:hypothetical protein